MPGFEPASLPGAVRLLGRLDEVGSRPAPHVAVLVAVGRVVQASALSSPATTTTTAMFEFHGAALRNQLQLAPYISLLKRHILRNLSVTEKVLCKKKTYARTLQDPRGPTRTRQDTPGSERIHQNPRGHTSEDSAGAGHRFLLAWVPVPVPGGLPWPALASHTSPE